MSSALVRPAPWRVRSRRAPVLVTALGRAPAAVWWVVVDRFNAHVCPARPAANARHFPAVGQALRPAWLGCRACAGSGLADYLAYTRAKSPHTVGHCPGLASVMLSLSSAGARSAGAAHLRVSTKPVMPIHDGSEVAQAS